MDSTNIEALAFDVFGTVVDWRGSLIREGINLGRKKGIGDVDWGQFADAWRKGYRPAMDRVRSGEGSWENIDTLHRMILDSLLEKFLYHSERLHTSCRSDGSLTSTLSMVRFRKNRVWY
jgi:2-haloacid dehalogenase